MDEIVRRYKQNWFVLWELTKRELKRKYARSYLGILWSSFYPLLRMALVVFLFSYVFSKGIDRYPAYYFVGYLIFEFFATATQTSLTTLKDNKGLLIKTKIPKELFVLSRVLTAFVNFLFGCIPFIFVLLWYRAVLTVHVLWVPVAVIFLVLFTTGVSYIVSILYVAYPDMKSLYSNFIFILRFFVALFFSVEWVSHGVKNVIIHNPVYAYIKVVRESIIYGQRVENYYVIYMTVFGIGMYLIGLIFFNFFSKSIMNRI